MSYPAVQQQAIVLAISNGNSVTVEQLRWAIDSGYVSLNDDEVEVTDSGWKLLRPEG